MNDKYFFYSIAQYVHDRREERLNLGVVVWDPLTDKLVPRFSGSAALKRVKTLYPEIDRMGMQLYLDDLAKSLGKDERLKHRAVEQNPLDTLARDWRNIVRFTPSRSFPAPDVKTAADRLMSRYVDERRPRSAERTFGGVERARQRTAEAIESVLDLPEMGYSSFHGERVLWQGGSKPVKIDIDFPFWLYEEYLIDTLSFEGTTKREAQRVADAFIQKLENVRKYDRQLQVHATVAVDPQRREIGQNMISYIQLDTGLGDKDVREADEAEVVVREIDRKRKAS